MNTPLSSLEKFGVLSRKFLHDTSNDFTAIGLNLHFIEKSIEPSHPAYKDFQNLAVALKNLQLNTRGLMNWRRQLPDPLVTARAAEIVKLLPPLPGWTILSTIDPELPRSVKVCPTWIASLAHFLAQGEPGTIRFTLIHSPNDQCATNEQVNMIIEPATSVRHEQTPDIEWSLHRELAKLMGGGIILGGPSKPHQTTLFLPAYS